MIRSLLLAAATLAACGPSSAEIKQARTARYTCEFDQVFKAMIEVVKEETPPLGETDPERGVVMSDFRWHSSSGMRKEAGATQVEQGDVGFVLVVAAVKDDAGFGIRTFPKVFSQSPDTPRGRELSRDDANWPGWADGKADKVQLAIHQKLSGCAARSP
jgi:hypothetical protein